MNDMVSAFKYKRGRALRGVSRRWRQSTAPAAIYGKEITKQIPHEFVGGSAFFTAFCGIRWREFEASWMYTVF
jgi:hypothetical protein